MPVLEEGLGDGHWPLAIVPEGRLHRALQVRLAQVREPRPGIALDIIPCNRDGGSINEASRKPVIVVDSQSFPGRETERTLSNGSAKGR